MSVATSVQAFLHRFGLELKRRHPYRSPASLITAKARELGVTTILDVGANRGQFGLELRAAGWAGRIVSFEPLSSAHKLLTEAADPLWTVPPPTAVGRSDGEIVINVSANSASSSLLNVTERSTDVVPQSGFTTTETVPIHALDSLLSADWGDRLALKIDTQGYEAEVLAGAVETLKRTWVLTVEISLVELYEGAPVGSAIFRLLEEAGFRCIAITEGFSDPVRNEMLQVDGTFVRI